MGVSWEVSKRWSGGLGTARQVVCLDNYFLKAERATGLFRLHVRLPSLVKFRAGSDDRAATFIRVPPTPAFRAR